jgi:hypothetical protein
MHNCLKTIIGIATSSFTAESTAQFLKTNLSGENINSKTAA